jgi:hypothetical protein
LIAIDGKTLRRSGGLAMATCLPAGRAPWASPANAFTPPSRWAGTTAKSPVCRARHRQAAVRQWLEKTEFTDELLALDSLHTQHATIHPILYDHGADDLLPLKANPPTILATAKTLLSESFSHSRGAAEPGLSSRRPG